MSAAIVLAGPERKRILRELLSLPEPWSVDTRQLYCQMLLFEYRDSASVTYEDHLAATVEKRTFGELVLNRVSVPGALEKAKAAGREAVQGYKREHSPGRRERERRRAFREAVTACDGALAVTTGLVDACIVCGGPFRHGRLRSDRAYCSGACRQSAYRKRRNSRGQQKPMAAIQFARERQERQRAVLKAGLSQSDINSAIRFAKKATLDGDGRTFEEVAEERRKAAA